MPEISKYSVEIFNINIQRYFFCNRFLNIRWKYSTEIFQFGFFLDESSKYSVQIFKTNYSITFKAISAITYLYHTGMRALKIELLTKNSQNATVKT